MLSVLPATLALLQRYNDRVPLVLLFEADLTTTLRLAMLRHDLTLGSDVYLGARGLGRIGSMPLGGSDDGAALDLEFSGVSATNRGLALSEPVQGRECRIYSAFFDPDTSAIVEKHLRFVGTLDNFVITTDGNTSTITAQAVSVDDDLLRPSGSEWTDAEQQRLFPGDLGWQYVTSQVEQRVQFPAREYFTSKM